MAIFRQPVKKITTAARQPVSFFLRQLYRIFVVAPWVGAVSLIRLLGRATQRAQSPSKSAGVLITSVIFPVKKSLSYSNQRSIFSPEERTEQTLKTIASVRERIPDASIVLVEAGRRKDVDPRIRAAVDTFYYVGDRRLVRWACDSSLKSLGETAMLLAARDALPNALRYYKISGRYYMTEEFVLSSWQEGEFAAFFIRPDFISTRLYSWANTFTSAWRWALVLGIPLLVLDYPIEHILFRYLPKEKIRSVVKAGVAGADATNGTPVKE